MVEISEHNLGKDGAIDGENGAEHSQRIHGAGICTPTLAPKVIQNNPNVGKYSIHGFLGISCFKNDLRCFIGCV